MSWVKDILESLEKGEDASVRPHGGSMRGRVESGQLVTLKTATFDDVGVDDIVFIRWKNNYLLHLVLEIAEHSVTGNKMLIGNNVGKVNGWVDGSAVLAKLTSVHPL